MNSKRFQVQISGPLACFTRPEFKVERVTYDVITPSAVRGILDSILWKPAIKWQVHEIAVLNPIVFTSFKRNEVNSKASSRVPQIYADEDRAQRNTVALKDVSYVVTVSFRMTDRAGERDNVRKFEEMFTSRLEKGQYHSSPCLGCREFEAEVKPAPATFTTAYQGLDRPLGQMLLDIDYRRQKGDSPEDQALWFNARMTNGIIRVPSVQELRSKS